jgi:hypothetical protein
MREGVDLATSRQNRIADALMILRLMGLPRQQQNERSALTLLALANLQPHQAWADIERPMRGVTQLMQFFREHYGKDYAPNTRETVRRQTIHQFRDAGMINVNPDAPQRPINSGQTVYQLTYELFALLQSFGSPAWSEKLVAYQHQAPALRERYAQFRVMQRIPVTMPDGSPITLSPGGQNELIREVVENFAAQFVPGGHVLYIGDADEKWAVFARERLRSLDVALDLHGKMPDVIIEDTERNWLVLIEAVTSHGPIHPQRHQELAQLFSGCSMGLVYVTAFLDRATFKRYLTDISWETEVWIAETPDHLVHFNGERFLGPYDAR